MPLAPLLWRPVEGRLTVRLVALLRRWHLPYRADMPAGEAADLIGLERLRRIKPAGRARG